MLLPNVVDASGEGVMTPSRTFTMSVSMEVMIDDENRLLLAVMKLADDMPSAVQVMSGGMQDPAVHALAVMVPRMVQAPPGTSVWVTGSSVDL